MRHASLFSGIGGFDLAAEWMGWENVLHCEINPFCQRILKYYWPNAISYADIKTTDFTIHRGAIDILSGGFPCQPFSTAGKRKGTEDDRHLWPEMLRAIREIQPRWIVGENVPGLINWNEGMVFEQVQADLENEGYEVQPVVLPACGVDAIHRRNRIWIIAYSYSNGGNSSDTRRNETKGNREGLQEQYQVEQLEKSIGLWLDSHSNSEAHGYRHNGKSSLFSEKVTENETRRGTIPNEKFRITSSPIYNGNHGLSERLDFASVFEGVPKPKRAKAFGRWRQESIKGGGNAVVPPLVLQLFKAIEEMELLTSK